MIQPMSDVINCYGTRGPDASTTFLWLAVGLGIYAAAMVMLLLRNGWRTADAQRLVLIVGGILTATALALYLHFLPLVEEARARSDSRCGLVPGAEEFLVIGGAALALALGTAWWLRQRRTRA